MWRDLGFAVGAILVGFVADRAGMATAIALVAAITAGSGIVVALRMRETRPLRRRRSDALLDERFLEPTR
jgi:predicted MFS family arabinose efflux permease